MKKRILSLTLTLFMLISLMPGFTVSAGAADDTVYPYYVITKGADAAEAVEGNYHIYKQTNSTGSFGAFTVSADVDTDTAYSTIAKAITAVAADINPDSVFATLQFGLTGTDAGAAGTLDLGLESLNLGTSGTYTIKGSLTSSSETIILGGASVLVNDAYIGNTSNNTTIKNVDDGSILISGGTVENTSSGKAIENSGSGDLTISGGTVWTAGDDVIYHSGSGDTLISGGTIENKYSEYDVIENVENSSGRIAISGGTLSVSQIGSGNAIYIDKESTVSEITITGGIVEANGTGRGIDSYNSCDITISGGKVYSAGESAIYVSYEGDEADAPVVFIEGSEWNEDTGTGTLVRSDASNPHDFGVSSADSVVISGGTIRGGVSTGGGANISGGRIETGDRPALLVSGSTSRISGGVITSANANEPDTNGLVSGLFAGTVFISDMASNDAKLYISGGTIANTAEGRPAIFNMGIHEIYPEFSTYASDVYFSGTPSFAAPYAIWTNSAIHAGDDTSAYNGSTLKIEYSGSITNGTTVAVSGVTDSNYSRFKLRNEGYKLVRNGDSLRIAEGVPDPDTYTIAAISEQTMTNLTAGYSSGTQETKSVTITKTGTGALTNLTAALSGANASSFTITQPVATVLDDLTASTTCTIKAVDSLPAGTYTAEGTIRADNMTPVTFTVTQTVGNASNGGDGGGGGFGGYTPSRTITVSETSSNLFSGTGPIKAEANMSNAFSNSVEVKVTDTKEDAAGFGLGVGNEVYPFDISLYIKGTITKTQPKDGYAVTISIPVPDKLLDVKEQISILHKANDGTVSTLTSQLKQINGVWYLVFEATEFSPYALAVKRMPSYDESAGLPYFTDANGSKVFIGFASNGKYIAPTGVTVLFKENKKTFADIGSHWAKTSIEFVAEREIFSGTGKNKFSPDAGMTRAMFATVVGRLYERSYGEIKATGSHAFADCNYGDYYGKYVDWAAEKGIIEGSGKSKFGPENPVTREQMAAILYRFADYLGVPHSNIAPVLAYPDAGTISSWAQSAASYCQTTGIIAGRTDGSFDPKETATRAEVAAIIQRFIAAIVD